MGIGFLKFHRRISGQAAPEEPPKDIPFPGKLEGWAVVPGTRWTPESDFRPIRTAFSWDTTPEGFGFWHKLVIGVATPEQVEEACLILNTWAHMETR